MLILLLACTTDNTNPKDTETNLSNPPILEDKTQVDEITQASLTPVDVLWVIDNSVSMMEEQQALRDNFGSFIGYFTDLGLDYHVGVVSTDMDNANQSGKLILDHTATNRYIDNTFSAEEALRSFQERADLGTRGSNNERAKDAAFAALNGQIDVNQGFYRDNASLSIIVISDEPDMGPGHSQISVAEFSDWMLGLKTSTDYTVSFSSIVPLTPNDCSTHEQGSGLLEVTERVGGIKWSICRDNWSELLDELGYQSAGLAREFFLSLAPVEDSIMVTVNDPEFGSDDTWRYDPTRNAIIFDAYLPPPLSTVSISYLPLTTSVVDASME